MIFTRQANAGTTRLPALASQDLLRRLIICSTLLSLAMADGWMASFQRLPNGDLACQWRWATLMWSSIGGGSGFYFWRQCWPPPGHPKAVRKNRIMGSVVLLLPCLWWLTSPLRFLSGPDLRDVMCGLMADALVLSAGAFMVIKLMGAFARSDAINLADSTHPPSATNTDKVADTTKPEGA